MEYEIYLDSVLKKLQADRYSLERATMISSYQVDLYAFKDTTQMSVITSTHKQVSFLIMRLDWLSRDVIADLCKSILLYENQRRGRFLFVYSGLHPSRIMIPVIISNHIIQNDAIASVEFEGHFWPQQYVYPVLVNLEKGEMRYYHRLSLFHFAYNRIVTQLLNHYIKP